MAKSFKEIKQTLLMLKSVNRRVAQNFEKKTGISLTRYEILQTVLDKQQLSQVELQQTLKIDQAAITRHLKILEEENLVVRNRNQQNNREVIVQITAVGINALENCNLGKSQFIDELFNGFTEQEIHMLQTLMKKLIINTETKS